MNSITIEKLTEHIISTIYEGLLKLGSTGNESYSIYYDLDLLNYLLGTEFTSKEDCLLELNRQYPVTGNSCEQANPLSIRVTLEKGRFKFTAPASSMDTIWSLGEKNSFLRDIIELVKTHHFTIEDVKQVFAKQTSDYVCEEINNPEFQYVLYFNNEDINHYKYCFSFDGCGGFYHRLLDYDYQNIINED